MGLVLYKFNEYNFKYRDEVIKFERGKAVYGLPHEIEDFLFHLGYFHCVYDKYDKPFLDEEDNCFKALDYKGNLKVAESQDWAAIVKCESLQVDFGAPLCSYGGGNRKTCTACLSEERECRFPNDSAAHILKGKNWVVMGGTPQGEFT